MTVCGDGRRPRRYTLYASIQWSDSTSIEWERRWKTVTIRKKRICYQIEWLPFYFIPIYIYLFLESWPFFLSSFVEFMHIVIKRQQKTFDLLRNMHRRFFANNILHCARSIKGHSFRRKSGSPFSCTCFPPLLS